MNFERWSRVEEVYHEVVACPPERRAAVLDASCSSDAELRQEVESLLAARDNAGDFLSAGDLSSHIAQLSVDSAPPAIGSKIGDYEILATLGAGAMGVVYRAHDRRLGREVALKILPPRLTSDPSRVTRFQSEARAASALNHPNTVTIYEIGQSSGAWFLATELIEGATLRERLRGGKLPIADTIQIGLQCATGLQAAHRAGIVHRDIKPENIMIRPDGAAKIVDFGLARILEPRPDWDVDATATGSVMGTPRYMSPEQARGQKPDARSDIFSLGAVLFEMAAGRPAFPGASTAEVFAALLGVDPDPADTGPLGVVVSKALAKDPAARYQTMDELATALANVDPAQVRPRRPRVARPRRAALAASLVAAVGLGAYFWVGRGNLAPETGLNLTPLTTFGGEKDHAALSPDGARIAFSWKPAGRGSSDIYIKSAGDGEPVQLTFSPDDEVYPAWSPNGRQIAFCRRIPSSPGVDTRARVPLEIYVVDAAGGGERKITQGWAGVSWSPDGNTLAVARVPDGSPTSGGIDLVSVDSGQARRLTSALEDRLPAFSPDGRWIVFRRSLEGRADEIFVVAASGGQPRRLTFDGEITDGAAWTGDSREIVFSSPRNRTQGRLWRIPVSGGSPRPVSATVRSATYPSFSRDGKRLAFTESWTDTNLYLRSRTAPALFGAPRAVAVSTRGDHSPAISPGGEHIAFISDRSGNQQVWVSRRDGSEPLQLTSFARESAGSPRWSPDGRRIAFDVWGTSDPAVYVIDSGGGIARPLSAQPFEGWMPAWSPDGEWVYFTCRRSASREIWKMPAHGGGTPVQVTRGGAYEARPSLDGKTIYFSKSTAKGCCAIWSVPAAGGVEQSVRELERFEPVSRSWGVLNEGIYFIGRQDAPVQTVRFLSFATGRVAELVKLDKEPGWIFPALHISDDGRHMMTVQIDREVNDLMMIDNFR